MLLSAMRLKLVRTTPSNATVLMHKTVCTVVGIIALSQNQLRIVQTSMLGSILSNLLLVLGCSFFAAGFKFSETQFQVTAAQASASTLTLAVATLIIPAAYHANQKAVAAGGFFKYLAMGEDVSSEVAQKSGLEGLLFISRGTAVVRRNDFN